MAGPLKGSELVECRIAPIAHALMLCPTVQEIMMRLVSLPLLATAILALAACDTGPQVDLTNATPAEVAKAMKDSGATRTMVRPGKWSSTVAILEMNSPGMPP